MKEEYRHVLLQFKTEDEAQNWMWGKFKESGAISQAAVTDPLIVNKMVFTALTSEKRTEVEE